AVAELPGGIVVVEGADVGAGAEGLLAGAGEDDAADVVVGVEAGDGGNKRIGHLRRHRVQLFRAIDGDDADEAVALDPDVLAHRCRSPMAVRCMRLSSAATV